MGEVRMCSDDLNTFVHRCWHVFVLFSLFMFRPRLQKEKHVRYHIEGCKDTGHILLQFWIQPFVRLGFAGQAKLCAGQLPDLESL